MLDCSWLSGYFFVYIKGVYFVFIKGVYLYHLLVFKLFYINENTISCQEPFTGLQDII